MRLVVLNRLVVACYPTNGVIGAVCIQQRPNRMFSNALGYRALITLGSRTLFNGANNLRLSSCIVPRACKAEIFTVKSNNFCVQWRCAALLSTSLQAMKGKKTPLFRQKLGRTWSSSWNRERKCAVLNFSFRSVAQRKLVLKGRPHPNGA